MDLLKTLIVSSEKAANISRLLRNNEKLFKKLVEQKSSAEANPRFQEDFKTLADVLIQEMVKYDVGSKFPFIRDRVYGEENNHFFSVELNKEIIVEVKECKEKTSNLLATLLDDDKDMANLLAEEVHREVCVEKVNTKQPPDIPNTMDIEQLSIWIDPIDGTNEYVRGGYEAKTGQIYSKGLKCVTVLIGAFNSAGQPVIGVINQPFFDTESDSGYQCHWGICFDTNDKSLWMSSADIISDWKETNKICLGGSECETIKKALESDGYNIVVTRGAGYKLLTIILGIADAYILSKPTTFFWDTCGPHAILSSLGGGIIEMAGMTSGKIIPISYSSGNSTCNSNGIVAYRNEQVLDKLLKTKLY